MESKLNKLKRFMSTAHYHEALRLAASWPRLGDHKDAIERGRTAMVHPEFYRQIGQDPETLIAAGIDAIRERYGIER
jgi:hypothetical protein